MTIASAPQYIEPEPASVDFRAANLCLDHELSTLEFNARVLAQARNAIFGARAPVRDLDCGRGLGR